MENWVHSFYHQGHHCYSIKDKRKRNIISSSPSRQPSTYLLDLSSLPSQLLPWLSEEESQTRRQSNRATGRAEKCSDLASCMSQCLWLHRRQCLRGFSIHCSKKYFRISSLSFVATHSKTYGPISDNIGFSPFTTSSALVVLKMNTLKVNGKGIRSNKGRVWEPGTSRRFCKQSSGNEIAIWTERTVSELTHKFEN